MQQNHKCWTTSSLSCKSAADNFDLKALILIETCELYSTVNNLPQNYLYGHFLNEMDADLSTQSSLR